MSDDFAYVRPVDPEVLAGVDPSRRYSQKLIDHSSGGAHASVAYIRTPPGGGSPRGLHTHAWEQIFYLLDGVMRIEVDGQEMDVQPGHLIVFPAGVAHRNWNATDQATVHIAINTPMPLPAAARTESS
jgi:quercetin dioxygenase-like cupin family protein